MGTRRLDAVRVVRTLALFVVGVAVTLAVAVAGVVVLGLRRVLVRFPRRFFPEVAANPTRDAAISPE